LGQCVARSPASRGKRIDLDPQRWLEQREGERRRQQAERRDRAGKHDGRHGRELEMLLHDQRAHRVTDQHGGPGHRRHGKREILYIVIEAERMQPLAAAAATVAAQRQGKDGKAARREPGEKVLGPGPRTDITAVNEKQRRARRVLRGWAIQKLDSLGPREKALLDGWRHCGTAMPRATAGLAEIVSNHCFTCGNSERSTLCHSCRATQGNVAMSAIEYSSARNARWARRRFSTAYSRRVSLE